LRRKESKKNQYQNFEDVPSQDRNLLALPVKKKSEQKFLNQKLEEEA